MPGRTRQARTIIITATPRAPAPWWPRNPDGTPSPVTLHHDGTGWTRGLDPTQVMPHDAERCRDLMEDFEFDAGGDSLGADSLFVYEIIDVDLRPPGADPQGSAVRD
jgi:hypothetical protein